MSASRPTVRLTPKARRDYERILLSSQRIWGEEQSLLYQSAIARTIETLRDHPQIGRQRDDLLLGCRNIQVEQHVIYYRQPRSSAIVVLRILHSRQDASTEVGDNA